MADVGKAGPAAVRVARRSLIWRYRHPPAVRARESSGQIEFLGVSCLMLMRTAVGTDLPGHGALAAILRELSAAISDIATDPGDPLIRQGAVDRVFSVARRAADETALRHVALEAAAASVRIVCFDIMVFAGVAPGDAMAAVAQGAGEVRAAAEERPGTSLPYPSVLRRLWRRLSDRVLRPWQRRRR